jgi:ribonuclease BN (tRNA processing enzyme)
LQKYVRPENVRAILISHMHADHTFDLIQYHYYLYFSAAMNPDVPRPSLYFPPEGHAKMLGVSNLQDPSSTFFSDVFDTHEYDPTKSLQLGSFTVDFTGVRHIPHTYGMRVSGSGMLAFSADSGPCEGLPVVAHDSDVFLCECSNNEQSEYPYHLTPRQAGSIAAESGAHRLLLTHRWWVDGHDVAVAEASERFGGPVTAVLEGQQFDIR